MILLSTLLIGLAIGFPAPIAAPLQDNINAGEATVRAPWFFLWVQQLLKSGDPFCLGILVPLMGLLLIGLIPFLPVKHAETGRWFPKSGRTAQFIASAIFLAVVILTLWAVAS